MRKIKRLKWLAGIIIFVMSYSAPKFVRATSPTEAIQETIETVFAILHDPALQGREEMEERNALLREAVAARFDFWEMARRTLGPHWERNAGKQDQFVVLFTELLAVVYLNTIEQGFKAEVIYFREYVDNEYAHVDTKVVLSDMKGFEVSYKLHKVEGEWKAYDVLVEDMSLIQNYRSQFYHILGRHSFDELLERMRKKIEKLRSS